VILGRDNNHHEPLRYNSLLWGRGAPPAGYDPAGSTTPGLSLPPPPKRTLLRDLVKQGDPKFAVNAVRSMREFVEAQVARLEERNRHHKPRRRMDPKVDPRLWLDAQHWVAWTLCGELVAIEQIEAGSGRGSPEVRRVNDQERRDVFAADRLIKDVIVLYHGDDLDRPPVLRYLAHNDLRQALAAALERGEPKRVMLSEPCETPALNSRRHSNATRTKPAQEPDPFAMQPAKEPAPHRKTRFDPAGNFVVYRQPDRGLPSFVALLPGAPVPTAFASHRHAERFLPRLRRLGLPTDGLCIARVLAAVTVEPEFRPGLDLPDEPEGRIALVRKEPRVVLPTLHLEWEPRYVQAADGSWEPEQFKKVRTIRNGLNQSLLEELGQRSRGMVSLLEESSIRRQLGADDGAHDAEFREAIRVARKANRRLPQIWRDRLGSALESLVPDWLALSQKAQVPLVGEVGHWLRAPFEFKEVGDTRPRRHTVELQIPDLAGLIELRGFRWRFLLIKDSTTEEPRWVLPLGEVERLALMAG
jgi:hypothetical protein